MKISIITPSYNQGQFIAQTIESVLSQEGAFALEYIVVDGGSTDGTQDIIAAYEKKLTAGEWPVKCRDISFRWLSEPDEGQSDAITKGFAVAGGEVIAWLNSDDTYMPGALQRVAEYFGGDRAGPVVYGRSFYTDESGRVVGRYPTGAFDRERLPQFNFISQPSVFFRRDAYEAIGGIDRSLQFVMDYDLWIRFAKQYDLAYLPYDLSTYRLHDFSKTVSDASALDNNREVLDAVWKHFGIAPANRVFAYTCLAVREILPPAFGKIPLLVPLLSLPLAIFRYVAMNRKIRLADLKMFTPANIGTALRGSADLTMEPIDE